MNDAAEFHARGYLGVCQYLCLLVACCLLLAAAEAEAERTQGKVIRNMDPRGTNDGTHEAELLHGAAWAHGDGTRGGGARRRSAPRARTPAVRRHAYVV